ncbi:SDR family oxidoreductase [Marinobacter sp. AN1]|uniref:SDR family oxidoreductase n=1 Tax=Marinobacter sp. AN1 TaxID=2886046 RepID=UPI00223087B9|nr:SDR family oxidoreductase [Marinobacter sp. AN1]UZD65292.1 SDR family oxidoreductase [Marinobacter sp. AN1]
MELNGKVVVVTGGASGIGAAMARRFAAEGARGVVVADRDIEAASQVAKEIAGLAVQVDVSVAADIERVVDVATAQYGPVDLFCSNAGIAVPGGIELPDEVWNQTWDVNLMAHVHAARTLVPRMLERGSGYLLNTASAAGLLSQFDAPYAVTKHAAVSFAEWLAITYGARGIGVSCLCPGAVDTPMFRSASEVRQELMSGGHELTADDVAQTVVDGLRDERFLILPHEEVLTYYQSKAEDIDRWLRGMQKLHARAD